MTLLVDAYYTMGCLHRYCEDYALHGLEPIPHLILADGCSAAPDSDLGARLLALNARRLLPHFARATDEGQRQARHWPLGQRLIRRAARQARDLGLKDEVLDATVLIAWCAGTQVHVHLYGDGCLVVCSADGEVATIQVDYAANAPYYLGYLLDPERRMFYQEAIGEPDTAQQIHYQSAAGKTTRIERFDHPTVFSFDLATFPVVAAATDGLDSLVAVETSTRLDLLTVARAMLDFHNLDGAFVQRRLRQALGEFARQRVFNVDDLSLGVFIQGSDDSRVNALPWGEGALV